METFLLDSCEYGVLSKFCTVFASFFVFQLLAIDKTAFSRRTVGIFKFEVLCRVVIREKYSNAKQQSKAAHFWEISLYFLQCVRRAFRLCQFNFTLTAKAVFNLPMEH